jgi:hypothetical protein
VDWAYDIRYVKMPEKGMFPVTYLSWDGSSDLGDKSSSYSEACHQPASPPAIARLCFPGFPAEGPSRPS